MSINGHNSVTNSQKKMTRNDPKLDIDNRNADTLFGQIMSICSKILSGNKIWT